MVLDPLGERTTTDRLSSTRYSWFTAHQCDECGFLSLAWARFMHGEVNYPSQAKSRMDAPGADVVWLPVSAVGRAFDDVPAWIAEAASEAYACHSVQAFRAAILLARSVVEAVAKDKNANGRTLADKIDGLAASNHIRPLIQQTAHEIRHLGNDMAHGDFVEPTTAEDSEDVLDFMAVVLAEVYQLPAQVNARQSTRAARRAAAEARRAEAN